MKILFVFLANYWRTTLTIALILFLSFAPPSDFSRIPTFENEDKLIHLLMYVALTMVAYYDIKRSGLQVDSTQMLIICVAFPTALGGSIEIFQPLFFYPRTASWFDFFADTLGCASGWMLMKFVVERYFRKWLFK